MLLEDVFIENELLTRSRAKRFLIGYNKIAIYCSGGKDSTVMLDLLYDVAKELNYFERFVVVFIDTLFELDATKRFVEELKLRYPKFKFETIERKAAWNFDTVGWPFLSKEISTKLAVLQAHNIDWNTGVVDRPEEITKTLEWYLGLKKSHNIDPRLREFLKVSPPPFKISAACCDISKKGPKKVFNRENGIDIECLGLRTAEGGQRGNSKTCWKPDKGLYYPILFWSNADIEIFVKQRKLVLSDAYKVYGFERTGCVGCPFNSRFEQDLLILDKFEPGKAAAARKLWKKVYDYTGQYKEFRYKRGKYGK